MTTQAFRDWYVLGLQALVAANDIGHQTTQKLKGYVTSPDLMKAIDEGSEASRRHAEVISGLLREAGAEPRDMKNTIMEGIHASVEPIAGSHDKDVRDAGVITASQQALHYYIAAYGGLASTARHLHMKEQGDKFGQLLAEVKSADRAYTEMAEKDIEPKAS